MCRLAAIVPDTAIFIAVNDGKYPRRQGYFQSLSGLCTHACMGRFGRWLFKVHEISSRAPKLKKHFVQKYKVL